MLKKLITAHIVGACMLVSCTQEMPQIPAQEEYTREFIKEFGAIDSRQDWNNATCASVDVSTDAPARVRVSTTIGGRNFLLADYAEVYGKQRLTFDIPRGITDIRVLCGTDQVMTKVNGSADFQSLLNPDDEGNAGVTAEICKDQKDWMLVPMTDATIFRRRLPESDYNLDKQGITKDFYFKFKDQDIIIRPIFWQTSNTLEFGLFSVGADGNPIHYPVYGMEKDTEKAEKDKLALCWSIPNTESITITDFRNNETFLGCLHNAGLKIEEKQVSNGTYEWINVNSTDNLEKMTSSADDRAMTIACRDYLELLGYKRDKKAEKRYNYVYRWRTTGQNIYTYDANGGKQWFEDGNMVGPHPSEDLEIVFIKYEPNYEETAKGWSTNNDMTSGISLDKYPVLISKGIKVHIDDISKAYGGYIKNGSKYMYSYSAFNKDEKRFVPKKGAQRSTKAEDYDGFKIYRYDPNDLVVEEGKNACRAVTWVGAKYSWRYMSFEDGNIGNSFNQGECDHDMQDFVFLIDGANTKTDDDDPVDKVVTPDDPGVPIKWTIASEDLGGTGDFDFNDVVFEIEHVAGSRTAKITPLAAGGTLETYLMYTDLADNQIVGGKEWHELFGAHYTEMVNTRSFTTKVEPIEITVAEGFTLASGHFNGEKTDNMGGFFIKVVRENGENTTITPPGKGEAPQMMLIYGEWKWPIETRDIRHSYGKFEEWMNSGKYEVKGDGTDWFDHVTGSVVNR